MGDDRYCFLHMAADLPGRFVEDFEQAAGWELPEDDISVPDHLMPRRQDEDDETILPSTCHPSYPFGNPYTRPLAAGQSGAGGALVSSSSVPSSSNAVNGAPPRGPAFQAVAPARSLATTLPALSLRHLYSVTTFGDSNERVWNEMGLDDLLEAHERVVEDGGNVMHQQAGEAPQPTGQNAGDHPEDAEDTMEAVDDD